MVESYLKRNGGIVSSWLRVVGLELTSLNRMHGHDTLSVLKMTRNSKTLISLYIISLYNINSLYIYKTQNTVLIIKICYFKSFFSP